MFPRARCFQDIATDATDVPADALTTSRLALDGLCSAIGTGVLVMIPWGGLFIGGYLNLVAGGQSFLLSGRVPSTVRNMTKVAVTAALLGTIGMVIPMPIVSVGMALLGGLSSAYRGLRERRAEPERQAHRAEARQAAADVIADAPQILRGLVSTHPRIVRVVLRTDLLGHLQKVIQYVQPMAAIARAVPAAVWREKIDDATGRIGLDACEIWLPKLRRAAERLRAIDQHSEQLSTEAQLERTINAVNDV